ncbi:MAG: NAD-dependent epimerase/dehydratase family protein [Candidatus Thorarchaeota archaeon]|jgi:UDP-glucose 4-epimerase
MAKTALVTGSAGFIGSNLVDHLLDRGYSVIGLDNFRTGIEANLESASQNTRFQLIKGDILEENLADFRSSIDVIYHLAAVASVKLSIEQPLLVHHNNTTATLKVLELARINQVPRVVFSSSAAVYGKPSKLPVTEETPVHPLSPYGASKLAAEMYLHAYQHTHGIETVILRYFNIYGPRQAFSEYSGVISIFVNQALQGMPVTIDGDGKQTRSLLYIDDIVEVTRRAGESTNAVGEILNVSGAKAISVLEVAERVLALTPESKSSIVHVDPRVGDVRESIGSGDRVKEVLGFTPKVTLDEGLERTVDWYRSFLRT